MKKYENAQAEIERLKELSQGLIQQNTELIGMGIFYQSRAAAWKRCAKMWKDALSKSARYMSGWCDGFGDTLRADQIIIISKGGNITEVTKPPPDWREKWVKLPKGKKGKRDDQP